jgi:hypothetical protein
MSITSLSDVTHYVDEHCTRFQINPNGLRVVLAIDTTGISDTGVDDGAVYAFAFGLLFLRPEVENLWLHVSPQVTGAHGRVREEQSVIIAALRAMGMHVSFVTTDGDHDLDGEHERYASLYLDESPDVPLAKIARGFLAVDGQRFIDLWPVSDLIHLLKNIRQRIRNHRLSLSPDGLRQTWLLQLVV